VRWASTTFWSIPQAPTRPAARHSLGQSRQWSGPDISKDFPYWRAYSMYPGQQEQSTPIYHSGAINTSPFSRATGSGTPQATSAGWSGLRYRPYARRLSATLLR